MSDIILAINLNKLCDRFKNQKIHPISFTLYKYFCALFNSLAEKYIQIQCQVQKLSKQLFFTFDHGVSQKTLYL